ncbi:MAG TPA: GMC family oxidoreductase [Vicinamibacterales bacterium]|nr:GMC family oxidoreductase [Vicinamibacterales bacterium]
MTQHYDVVIIGSGAGGGTMAYALAGSSARILLIERGDYVPQEKENWSPEAVWRDRRYRPKDEWWFDDRAGRDFRPYTHYGVGGNTKFWGSALFRFRREDFAEMRHRDGISPAWPIDYDTLEPYYQRAEALYQVHGAVDGDPTEPSRGPYPYPAIPHTGRMAEIVEQLRDQGLHPSSLPLGLRENCIRCRTCNSFACHLHAKSEADVCCVRPALQQSTVTLWTNAYARVLETDQSGTRVLAVQVERDGQTIRVEAPLFVVSCGAVNSAALLLRSASAAHPKGLGNSSGLVGRRYMAHLATFVAARSLRLNDTDFQKTVAINDFYLPSARTPYPLGQIQSQGRTQGVMLKAESPWYSRWIPLSVWEWWASGAVDWLVMSEDLPQPENRVALTRDGRVSLNYRQNNRSAHQELVRELQACLKRLGFVFTVKHSLGTRNTTHQCGTLVFGDDRRTSVLNTFCQAHDVDNLFVVDASFFPSSAAVNPGLTIVAQALRVADHLKETRL